MSKGKKFIGRAMMFIVSLGLIVTAGVVVNRITPAKDDVPYEFPNTPDLADTSKIVFEIEETTDSDTQSHSSKATDSENPDTDTESDSDTQTDSAIESKTESEKIEDRESLYIDISSILADKKEDEYLNSEMLEYYEENPYPEIEADVAVPPSDFENEENTVTSMESEYDDESTYTSSDDGEYYSSDYENGESSEYESQDESEDYSSSETESREPVSNRILLDVPFYSQRNVMPTGCELVSAKMLLAYYGYNVSNDDIMNNLVRSELKYDSYGRLHGRSPFEAFIGNPERYSGFGCYPPVIENMIGSMGFYDIGVVNTSSQSLDTLAETYLTQGCPVMVWATIGLVDSYWGDSWYLEDANGNITNEKYTWRAQEHCMVLVGYDEDYYYFNDPLAGSGAVKYDRSLVERRYAEMGSYSLVIMRY